MGQRVRGLAHCSGCFAKVAALRDLVDCQRRERVAEWADRFAELDFIALASCSQEQRCVSVVNQLAPARDHL